MKNKEANNLKKFLPAIIILLSVLVLVIAANGGGVRVETTAKLTTFYAVEDTDSLLNITVNNSATTYGATFNITQVNITVPANITLTTVSGETNNTLTLNNCTHVKSGNTLSWSNFTAGYLMGGVNDSYWFNFTAATPGTYKFQVWIVNASRVAGDAGNALAHQTNITVIVNDTTAPGTVNITSPKSNSNNTGVITLNVSVSDNARVLAVNFTIINITGSTNVSYNASVYNIAVAGGAWNATLNTTEFTDGWYNITIWTNDTSGNINNTAVAKNVLFDNTVPVVTLTASTKTSDSITVLVGISGALGGIDTSCTSSRGTVTGTSGSQIVTETGLACGTSYTYTLTCTDKSGLTGTGSGSFSTSSCGGGSSGGSSTGGVATTFTWTNTYKAPAEEFSEGIERELSTRNRVEFSVGSGTHHVGIKEIKDNKVTIEIASTPITVTLAIGEETKADVDSDGTYDVYVKLNSVTNGKADVTIKSISEKVPITAAPETGATTGDQTGAGEETTETGGMGTAGIVVIVLIIIAALVGAGFAIKKKK